MTETPSHVLLSAILHELRGLRADIQQQRRSAPDAGELLRQIGDTCGTLPFTSRELVAHCELHPELRASIVHAVGSLNTKRLGKCLKRMEGVEYGGLAVHRAGDDRIGALWQVRECGVKPASAFATLDI